jgi:tetratricopeptide (TPR) repeat protein
VNQLPPRNHDRWLAAAVALALFAVYAAGACRTIYVGDSGELVTAVHILGIPHPSGYPLYVLVGKLWTVLVPVGSIAFRMSLFSAACAAAACALLFVTSRQDGVSRVASLFGAGLLAFGPSFWQEANVQRVYALNALMLVLALNRALAWHRERQSRDLVLAMLACGVGATNHTVMALVGAAVAIWAPIVEPSLFRRPKIVAACGAAFFAGLSVYAYLPIRARMRPALNWGEPDTLERFLDVVLRRDFWHRAWWQGPADLVPILADFAKSLGPETGFAGVVLAIVVLVVRPDRKWLLPLLVVALNVAALARHGSRLDIFVWHRYYIPSYLAVAFLAAAGLDALRARVPRAATTALAIAIPAVLLATGWHDADRSRHRFAEDFGQQVLDSLPPGAKLLTRDDNVLFVQLYLRHVEKLRSDVELVAEGVDQRKPALMFHPDEDAVFFTHWPNWQVEGLEYVPRGVVIQAIAAGRMHPPAIEIPPLPGLDDPRVPRDFLTRGLVAHYWFLQAMTWEARDWPRARDALQRTVESARDHDLAHYNAGLIWARNGFYDEALEAFEAADRLNPRGIYMGLDRSTGEPLRLMASDRLARVREARDRVRSVERAIAAEIPVELRPGSAAWHRAMAGELAGRGELPAARRHSMTATATDRR